MCCYIRLLSNDQLQHTASGATLNWMIVQPTDVVFEAAYMLILSVLHAYQICFSSNILTTWCSSCRLRMSCVVRSERRGPDSRHTAVARGVQHGPGWVPPCCNPSCQPVPFVTSPSVHPCIHPFCFDLFCKQDDVYESLGPVHSLHIII